MAQNNLTLTLQQLDGSGNVLARKTQTISNTDPGSGEWRVGNLPDTAQATISFTGLGTQVLQLQLKNTHASALITVVWTPTTGSQATVLVLGPGDIIAFWHTNTGTTFGISSLKLTSDTASTPFELFLGTA
jgi:hypothetical protein